MKNIFDYRVERIHSIISPQEMGKKIPASEEIYSFILNSRKEISGILKGKDERFLLIVGPCSIHDTEAAFDYALRLSALRKKYADSLYIIMRSYFEKPRTVSGWRGLIVEPDLNGFINIAGGLEKARNFLIKLAEIQLPAATEMLDPIVPQYIADLVSWASIGARSAESQMHRELASGLSMPAGFKNTTYGDLSAAVNGVIAARLPHAFVGIARNGLSAIIHTTGNEDAHLILRGGTETANYDKTSVLNASSALEKENIKAAVLIDCSHGNSQKNPEKQPDILLNSLALRFDKDEPLLCIRGCMLESFIQSGTCSIDSCRISGNYGKSVTDSCMSWELTEKTLEKAYNFILMNKKD